MPKVSVVIPAYNSARFLGETIRSVLDQTFQDFELILIDDGSRDNTKEVVGGFKDSRIKYLYQENRGVSAARNNGFNLSHGWYTYFLDSDDVVLIDTLEKSVAVLDGHPEVGFSYGQAWIMEENGHIYRLRKSSFQEKSGLVDQKKQIRELLYVPMITTSTVMARRECLEKIGCFNEAINSISEDEHLFMRLIKKFPVFYIAEPLVKYRVHTGQLHKRVDPLKAEEANKMVLEEIYGDPRFAPQFQKWKGMAYCHAYFMSAGYAYGRDMALARIYIGKAMKAYPQTILHRDGLMMTYKYLASFLPVQLWAALRDLKWRIKGLPLSAKE